MRTILDGLPTAAYFCDLQGQITYFNEHAAELWGRKPDPDDRFCGALRCFTSSLVPLTREQSSVAVALREQRVVYQPELIIERPCGQRRHVSVQAKPYHDDGGQLIGCVVILFDVTESVQTKQALLESEERYRLLANNVSVVLWEGDAQTLAFTYVSDFAEQLLGFPRDAWYEPNFWPDRIHPEDRDWVISYCQTTTQAFQDHRFEYRMIHADGRIVWVDDVVKITVEAGRVTAMHGVLIDITERKLAAEESLRQQQRWEQLAAAAPAAICIYQRNPDGTGSYPYASRGIEFIYGIKAEELIEDASASWKLIHPDDVAKVRTGLDESMRTMSIADCEYRVRHPSRGEIWVAGRGVPQRRADGSIRWSGYLTDITERKRLEERLQQSDRLEAIGRLAGGVAHDFNNLLTVINGNCHLLLSNAEQANLPREELLAIRDAGARASLLTRQLLAFAKGQEVIVSPIDINQAITSARSLMQQLLGKKIELKLELEPTVKPVMANNGQLQQVILNLAANARDAMPEGGVFTVRSANIQAESSADQKDDLLPTGEYVALSFCDNGIGMTNEVKSRIFEPFYTTKNTGERTGLGLAVVHGIVQQLGGSINIVSEVNSGATIRILLPAKEELPADTA